MRQIKRKVDNALDKPTNRIDLQKALELRLKNKLSYDAIAQYFGVSPQAVHERLQKFKSMLADPEMIEQYDKVEDQILTSVKMRYCERLLDPDAIKKASARDASIIYGTLFDKQRLIRGQGGANHLQIFFNIVSDACNPNQPVTIPVAINRDDSDKPLIDRGLEESE